jgi:hypothetical protein
MRSFIDQISDALEPTQYTVRDILHRNLDCNRFNIAVGIVLEERIFTLPQDIVSEAARRIIEEEDDEIWTELPHNDDYDPDKLFETDFTMAAIDYDIISKEAAMEAFETFESDARTKYLQLKQTAGEKAYNYQMKLFDDLCLFIKKQIKMYQPTGDAA